MIGCAMFESLGKRLGNVFNNITGRGALSEENISDAMREVRIALLEADVALPVVKEFIASVKEKALGQEVVKSVSPGQMVVKIVHDHLVALLGAEQSELHLKSEPPTVVLMLGLQGSGKTTSTGKLAKFLNEKKRKKVLIASLDVYRPAAQKQLAVLGEQIGVDSLEIIADQQPLQITERALKKVRLEGYDAVILDTAGRLHIDEALMTEVAEVSKIAQPTESLLVVDSMTGQDAVNVAKAFSDQIGLTGVVLTRVDGDARGGAALSMRSVTGQPIKFMGTGEKLDALEPFHPDRVANRILDMGDVVSLVEKASEVIEEEEAEKFARKVQKGTMNLNDMAKQLKQVTKMGGIQSLMGMLPGMGKMKDQLAEANIDESHVKRQLAVISSMTEKERRHSKLLNASRKKRIAAGAGVQVQDVNRLLKQFQQAQKMMKRVSKIGKKGLLRGGFLG